MNANKNNTVFILVIILALVGAFIVFPALGAAGTLLGGF